MEVSKTGELDVVTNHDSDKERQDIGNDDNGKEQQIGIENDCSKEQHIGIDYDDCGKEQDVVKNDCDEEQNLIKNDDCGTEQQEVLENVCYNKEQQDVVKDDSGSEEQYAEKNDHGKEQDLLKNDSYGKEQQDVVKDDNLIREQQDIVNYDSHGREQQDNVKKDNCDKEQHNVAKKDSFKEQDVVKNEDCVEEQQSGEKLDVHSSSNEENSQKNKSRKIKDKNEETCVKNEESENINEQNGEKIIKKQVNIDRDNNSHLPHVKQVDENSKLSKVKVGKAQSIRKLREVSRQRELRNKRRSRQREQINLRHRSSSKDITKLLKKKRNVHRQQPSTSQDDDQSVNSGTKRKRIPNRPGISFEIGARIEAKDYLDKWYPSKIIAVDEEAAEVLIHFERWSARFDEWMPMESPRIRAITHPSTRNEQKEKTNKVMPQYKAGEAVLARWTDCKMYPAKVLEVGANNCYEVLFYDGFHRTVQSLNIEKLPREMTGKVDFPSIPKSESPERKKSSPLPKDPGKLPPKKVEKIETSKRDHNDLTSILGKRKRLIVGGIFQAKRNKTSDEKSDSSSKHKSRKNPVLAKEPNMETIKSSNIDDATSPASPVGYIDGRKIARKEFIIEEDHNHFKCPISSCGKSFRKDKLLQSHMKHYHGDSRNREKKKSSSLVRDTKTVTTLPSVPVSPTCEKITEKEESKSEVLKTKLKSPVKEETNTDVSKSINTPLTTSPKAASIPNNQECLKNGKISKSRTDAKHNKTTTAILDVPTDNKANTVRSDGRVTRSEKIPKIEHKITRADKPTRAETRSSKLEGKLAKTENKNIKTENRITKAESKAAKIENRVKSENKSIKNENKNIKSENKTIKSENKTIKTENKPIEEKTEKSKIGQENKIVEEIAIVQPLPAVEDTKSIDSGINMATTQVPVLPIENSHTSRSKKRRTTSASEVNIEASCAVDNITYSVIPKETDIKSEQKLIDVENVQDDVKPMITDIKPLVQEEDAEEGQSDEIVHCICNCIEENGLMMQCEVCLTWQHGACFDIDDVKEVPDKYVCYACLKPIGLRESFRYCHDLDWFNKGEMTTFSFLDEKPSPSVVNETLSAHDLVASLHNAMSVLHSLQIKLKFAKEDNHPDLIMWKKPWMDYSYLHCQELDSSEELVQPTRADFDHSYFSVKEDLLVTTNALNTRRNDKANKREGTSSTTQDGETSQSVDRNKTGVNGAKCRSTDKERISGKQSFVKSEIKPNIEFDPGECRKNLLDHLIQIQHGVEQQLNIIEEHLQVLESEMGIPTLSDEDLQKEMGKSLCTIRRLTKDLLFVQQLTNFQ